jgi:hypothetical protein
VGLATGLTALVFGPQIALALSVIVTIACRRRKKNASWLATFLIFLLAMVVLTPLAIAGITVGMYWLFTSAT